MIKWLTLALVASELLFYPYVVSVSGECRLAPGKTQKARAAIGGRIAEVMVSEGQYVHRGDPLLRFDDNELRLDMERALSGRRSAENKATLRYWQSEVARLRAMLDLTVLRANIDGEVISPATELVGKDIDAGEALLTISDTREIVAEILVAERDIGNVAPGQKAIVRAYSDPEKSHDSTVELIVPAAAHEAFGTFVIVKARLDNSDGRLLPGTSGVAKILGRRQNGLALLRRMIARFAAT